MTKPPIRLNLTSTIANEMNSVLRAYIESANPLNTLELGIIYGSLEYALVRLLKHNSMSDDDIRVLLIRYDEMRKDAIEKALNEGVD